MNRLFAGILGTALTVSAVAAAEKPVSVKPASIAAGTDSAEDKELEQVMADDDAALAEVDQWIQHNNELAAKGARGSDAELNRRIRAKIDVVRQRYQDFLHRHPDSADGHLAYGTFLNDTGNEDLAVVEYEMSRKLNPTNPAVWNNLGNYYGEASPVTNAFADYTRAIELDPKEPVYYQNFATTVYLYRKDAKEFYHINESQVFDKALDLYRQAIRLDPTNFTLATDYAESYYGIKPLRTNDALMSWTNAMTIARDELEREGVHIHLARWKMIFGRYQEARGHLDAVTNAFYEKMKNRVQRTLEQREHPGTNDVIAVTNPPVLTNAAPPAK